MVKEIEVRLAEPSEDPRIQALLQEHHYLRSLRKIGETLQYVATCGEKWVALLIFSAAALKIAAEHCHPLPVVLAIATGAYLFGARGHQAMGAWAEVLTPGARAGLRCRCERNHYRVPSASLIRDVLGRVDTEEYAFCTGG
jgi:hypothetical protein